MAKTYKVGILGNQDGVGGFFGGKYGAEVFDLTADQICNFLENPDIDQSVQASRTDFPAPTMKYEVMGGGRVYPGISREDLSEAVQDIEVLIARLSTKDFWSSIFGRDFFQAIFSENAAKKCKMVIARIVGEKQTRTRRGQSVSLKTEDFLKSLGLDMETFKCKGNFFVITDKSQAKTETQKKSKLTNKVNSERVRSELAGEEVKMAVTQPVKETVSAGKAVIGLGARLGRWFSSLVH